MAKVLIILFSLLFLEGFQAAVYKPLNKTKLLIDHDGGADDAMAIFMCLLYEKHFNGPEVVGLTLTHGNVNESQVYTNTQRILNVAGRYDIPIYRGATRALMKSAMMDYYFGVDGLGDQENVQFQGIRAQNNQAAFALIELSKKYRGKLVIIAIASLTNIALAKRIDPEFIGRLKHLYVGAGNIYSDHSTEPEFNALMDVDAYHIVVDGSSPDKVTVVPFSEIKVTLNITNEWRTDVLGTIPSKIMQAQNGYEAVSLPSSSSWTLLDPAVAAIALEKAVVDQYSFSNNSIILNGDYRGINTNDFESESPNVRMVCSTNEEYYKKLLIDIFSAEL